MRVRELKLYKLFQGHDRHRSHPMRVRELKPLLGVGCSGLSDVAPHAGA